jgi:hypothetical protein
MNNWDDVTQDVLDDFFALVEAGALLNAADQPAEPPPPSVRFSVTVEFVDGGFEMWDVARQVRVSLHHDPDRLVVRWMDAVVTVSTQNEAFAQLLHRLQPGDVEVEEATDNMLKFNIAGSAILTLVAEPSDPADKDWESEYD